MSARSILFGFVLAFVLFAMLGGLAALMGWPFSTGTDSQHGMASAAGMCPGSGEAMMSGMDKMMGSMITGAAGGRIDSSTAKSVGEAFPAGATVDTTAKRITFDTQDVRLVVLGSPEWGTDMTFEIAGMSNPTIVVPQGATVTVQFIQSDEGTSHGWWLTSAQPPYSCMPMMSTPLAFSGSSAVPLGGPTSAGMPSETTTFTATTAGRFIYLCPVPEHAQKGMLGTMLVQ